MPVYYILAGGVGEGPLQLQELADVSGGEGDLATSGGSIENYALEVAQGLNNQYLIGYHPKNGAANGKWRKLSVRVTPPPFGERPDSSCCTRSKKKRSLDPESTEFSVRSIPDAP